MDTIYALSSGALPSGIAVVRVSGPGAGDALERMAGPMPSPGQLKLRTICDPFDQQLVDRGMVFWSPGPRSFTGEDVCEFHVHGGRAVVGRLIESLAKQNFREAGRGEFIRRAFENGRLDLTEVEGLADLIAAETEVQRQQAISHAGGLLRRAAEGWQEDIIRLRAGIEAQLDFSDEGDVGERDPAYLSRAAALSGSLRSALRGFSSGERIREGFTVAIVGRPNAGKSSLLNVLVRREVAIVTDEPGTTRDLLEVQLDLGGYPVRLFDTAGLREANSAAEREGVRRARAVSEEADLVLWLRDLSDPCSSGAEQITWMSDARISRINSKADLAAFEAEGLAVSSLTGQGIEELLAFIGVRAKQASGTDPAILTRLRHRSAVEDALSALEAVPGAPEEVAAHLLRQASDAIGRLSGRVDVENVLDQLFSEFCIGK